MPARLLPLLLCLPTALAAQLPVASPDQEIVRRTSPGLGLTFANPSFAAIPNATAHQQDMVVEHRGWQYVAWWNQDRFVEVGRRRRFALHWETLVLSDYRLSGEDAHDTVNLGISPGDGALHLAFDHHVSTLHYRVSNPGLAHDPSAYPWRPALFGPTRATLDPARGPLRSLTYPRFVPTPDGGLHMAYREFTSGNGRIRLVDYDAAAARWSSDRVFLERTGNHTDPLGGSSSARNPYLNALHYDDQGVLHATWTWRERAPTAYNRDIAYAYSPDGGTTWWNGTHQRIADTGSGQAVNAASPNVTAVRIGAAYGLMNNQAQTVDRRGRVHVVMYHKDVADTRVSYGNQSNSHYNHYWKGADGRWRHSRLRTIGDRPKMFAAHDGTLFLSYVKNGVLSLDRSTPGADYLDWTTVRRFAGGFGSSSQGTSWSNPHGTLLSLATQGRASAAGAPTSLSVVDFGFLPAPAPQSFPLLPLEDAYVRSGRYADQNYGSSDRLLLKANTPDFTRATFLKFDVSFLRGLPVRRVLLVGSRRAAGFEARTTPYLVHAVANDRWAEGTLTWNNRPTIGAPSAAHFGRDALQWDVTALATAEANGDGVLSLALTGGRSGADRILHLSSREFSDPQRRTRLVFEF